MNGAGSEVLAIEGPLTMGTVGNWLARGRASVRAGDLLVDLSAVTAADSAALALLFDWVRVARQAGRTVRQTGMPAAMRSLATLYGVEELLPGEA